MRVTGSWWRGQYGRARLLGLLAGVGVCGLIASTATAPAATAAAGQASSGPAAAHPATAPTVPASSSFVMTPQIAAGQPDVKQACSTPSKPGQMACMALISTRKAVTSMPAAVRTAASAPGGPEFDPTDLLNAYQLASAAAEGGDGEKVAVVDAYNDPDASSNLAAYRSAYGLSACDASSGCLRIENERGNTSDLPKADATGGWELEESLDLDMVSAICPNCSILLVEASSDSISDLAIAERTATRSGAESVSNSWGSGAEFTGENAFDPDFYAPGVAITAAGGDDSYGTQYPEASPYVTAVGGTSLSGSTGNWTQTAWGGTGSGCSELEPKPSWQTTDDTSPDGCLNRTANDVSAEADPNPGVWIYDTDKEGGWTSVGGTSVATPIVAASYALADIVAGGPAEGLIPATFPAAYPYQDSSAFTDITSGSNGSCESDRRYLCHAVTGYDAPTGVGAIAGTAGLTGPPAGELTVMDPGTRVYQTGAKVRIQLNVLPGSDAPAMAATGLSGATVGADQVLTGTASSTTGVHKITVTATGSGIASGSATFSIVTVPRITAAHPVTGQIRLDGGSMCLTGADYSTAAGKLAQLRSCADRSAQKWKFRPAGSTSGTGLIEVSGKCLEVKTGSADGAKVSIQNCVKGSTRQDWTYQADGHVHNSATGKCLAIRGKANNGRQVVVWGCGGGASLGWVLPGAPVLSGVSGRCLSDPGGSSAVGTRIELASCSGSARQHWTAERNLSIEIKGKCLAVKDNSLLDGAAIALAKCTGSANQRWARGPNGQLIDEHSGRCLADPANSRTSGTKLEQEDCYSEPGEIWVIS